MSTTQLTNFSAAAGVIVFLLSQFGIIIPQDKAVFIIAALWTLGSTALNYWHRFQKGDITLGGVRK